MQLRKHRGCPDSPRLAVLAVTQSVVRLLIVAAVVTWFLAACSSDGGFETVGEDDTSITVLSGPEQPASDDSDEEQSVQADDDQAQPLRTEADGASQTPDDRADGGSSTPDDSVDGASPTTAGPVIPSVEDPLEDPALEGRANVAQPDGALTDLGSGSATSLDSEIGDGLTLVWFWSPQSSTAEREAAVVQRFADTFGPSVDVVAVGAGGDRVQADAFLATTGLTVTMVWSSGSDAADHYQIESVPQSLLVDGAGNIIGRWPGLPEEVFRFVERIS